jgi:hypothetical protein
MCYAKEVNVLESYQMVYLRVLIVVIFFRFDSPHHGINNFQVRSSNFPGLGREQYRSINPLPILKSYGS